MTTVARAPLRLTSAFWNSLKAPFLELTGSASTSGTSNALSNPWYISAAVAFSTSNRPEGVPLVFQQALQDLRDAHAQKPRSGVESNLNVPSSPSFPSSGAVDNSELNELKTDEKRLAQKIREALFKSGLISGYPKVINSLVALHKVMPSDLQVVEVQRNTNASLPEYATLGRRVYNQFYGPRADDVEALLTSAYPDMGWFSTTIGYGVVYGHLPSPSSNHYGISPLETSFAIISALIAGDTPQQMDWHLDVAQRLAAFSAAGMDTVDLTTTTTTSSTGSESEGPAQQPALSEEEKTRVVRMVQATREVAIRVGTEAGVQWVHQVPDIVAPSSSSSATGASPTR